MKKSSVARTDRRLKKKAFIKENQTMLKTNKCWDELHLLHAGTVALLFSTKNITPLLRDEKALAKVNKEEVLQLANLIARDLELYKNKIDAIYAKHSKRTGGSDDPDTLFECIDISQEYMALTDSFSMVVAPNIDRILNIFEEIPAEITEDTNNV